MKDNKRSGVRRYWQIVLQLGTCHTFDNLHVVTLYLTISFYNSKTMTFENIVGKEKKEYCSSPFSLLPQ